MKRNEPQTLPLSCMARRLGIKPSALRAAAEDETLPALRIGKDFIFAVAETEERIADLARKKWEDHDE